MNKELKLDLVDMVNKAYYKNTLKRNIKHNKKKQHRIDISFCLAVLFGLILFLCMFIDSKSDSIIDDDVNTQSSKITYKVSDLAHNSLIEDEYVYVDPKYIDDIGYFAKCVQAEAGNQDEMGKRLVIDVILNRCDKYNITSSEVINTPNQFEVVSNGSIDNVPVDLDLYSLIIDEIMNRSNDDVLYFRTDNYHTFGTPLFKHQDHYFSY